MTQHHRWSFFIQNQRIQRINTLLITWFGCGLVPKAPGTMGTLGTVPLAWVLALYTPWSWRVAIAIVMTVLACFLVGLDQLITTQKDPQYVVIDETVGFLWSTAWIPAQGPSFVLAFALFRLFDVIKPLPASTFDRASKTAPSPWMRGAHIVLDDVVAGFYAAWACQLAQALL